MTGRLKSGTEKKLYETGEVEKITGSTLRPGGLDLTREAIRKSGFSPGASILDIGCGSGATLRMLRDEFGYNSIGSIRQIFFLTAHGARGRIFRL